jgi:hypothetical protein
MHTDDTLLKQLIGRNAANAVFVFVKRTRLGHIMFLLCAVGAAMSFLTLLDYHLPGRVVGSTLALCFMAPNAIQMFSFMQIKLLGFLLLQQFEPWYLIYLSTSACGAACAAFGFDVRAAVCVGAWLNLLAIVCSDAVRAT